MIEQVKAKFKDLIVDDEKLYVRADLSPISSIDELDETVDNFKKNNILVHKNITISKDAEETKHIVKLMIRVNEPEKPTKKVSRVAKRKR